jgi:predicted phosphoribosyltransferase
MAGVRIEIEVPDELAAQLKLVADTLGIPTVEEAAIIAVADWVSRRKSELDDRDPDQKYFVNEALDELNIKK